MNTDLNSPTWTPHSIRTFTGKVFDLQLLHPDSICIEDIAHALSHTSRFAGHLPRPYTVAQHSMMAALHAPEEHKLAALLHDASEAYLGDMPSPFKKLMPDYKAHEARVMYAIAQKLGFDWPLAPEIKTIDTYLLHQEWETHVANVPGFEPWSPATAKKTFRLFYEHLKNSNVLLKNDYWQIIPVSFRFEMMKKYEVEQVTPKLIRKMYRFEFSRHEEFYNKL